MLTRRGRVVVPHRVPAGGAGGQNIAKIALIYRKPLDKVCLDTCNIVFDQSDNETGASDICHASGGKEMPNRVFACGEKVVRRKKLVLR